ncbi:unnamed protein product [Lepidochelys olivacea]
MPRVTLCGGRGTSCQGDAPSPHAAAWLGATQGGGGGQPGGHPRGGRCQPCAHGDTAPPPRASPQPAGIESKVPAGGRAGGGERLAHSPQHRHGKRLAWSTGIVRERDGGAAIARRVSHLPDPVLPQRQRREKEGRPGPPRPSQPQWGTMDNSWIENQGWNREMGTAQREEKERSIYHHSPSLSVCLSICPSPPTPLSLYPHPPLSLSLYPHPPLSLSLISHRDWLRKRRRSHRTKISTPLLVLPPGHKESLRFSRLHPSLRIPVRDQRKLGKAGILLGRENMRFHQLLSGYQIWETFECM